MKFYTNVQIYRDEILLRGYEDGERIQRSVPYAPYLFEPNKVYRERGVETPYKTIRGVPVYKREFDSMRDARNYIKENADVSNKTIYGLTNFQYAFINDYYPGTIDYDPKMISIVTLDIEVSTEGGFPDIDSADKMITAITVRKKGQSIVLGMKDYKPSDDSVRYFKCVDEADMLEKFLTIWQSKEYSPDVLTGWNVEFFDIPYIVNRIRRIKGEAAAKRLSPWGILEARELEIMGRTYTVYTPLGISIIDYLQAYRKFSFAQQESFKLDHIAFIELGERKLDYSEYESMHEFYEKNFQKYIDYNIHDVVLVDKLEDKLKFMEQIFAIAYDGHVNFVDAFTSVRMWDVIIHNYLLSQGTVIPLMSKQEKDGQIVGAYVKEPKPGMYKWVVSFDLNSLYPHLIMQYNISPETYVDMLDNVTIDSILNGGLDSHREYLEQNNLAIAASGCLFDRDRRGFLPTLMEKMYNDRVQYKKQMLVAKQQYEKTPTYELEKEIARCHNMQLAKKIQLNSAYGALSNVYFRWFDTNLAESITKSGQLSIRWMERNINAYLNKTLKTEKVDYVIACDTDSMYLNLDGLVQQTCADKSTDEIVKFLDNACEKIFEPYIDKTYERLAEYVNAYDQKMKMKREAIADKGIWTAKKRYILNVYNNEGVQYAEPKLKLSGIEAVRSSTPSACRDNIKEALKLIMSKDNEELVGFIKDFRKTYEHLPFEDIAFPRSVRGLSEYGNSTTIFKKSTPIHVKGALIYNHILNVRGLSNKYPAIMEGEKIKFCYLRVPNPTTATVIAAPGSIPKELNIEQYIDRDKQFDKSFIEPIKTITDAIGWSVEDTQRVTIEDFF